MKRIMKKKKFIFYKLIEGKKVDLLELILDSSTSKEILKESLSWLNFDGIDTVCIMGETHAI